MARRCSSRARSIRTAASDADNRRIGEEREKRKYNVRAFDTFPVRRWDRWVDDRQLHVFVKELAPGATARDLLAGTRLVQDAGFGARALDTGDQLDAVWTPDGSSIVFAATTARDAGAYTSVMTDLFEVPARGGEPRQLTTRRASYSQPRFAPDGRTLFYVVADEDEQIYSHDRIGTAPWPWTGETRTITATFDRSVATWIVAGDSRSVYLTAEDEGLEKLYSVPAAGGTAQLLVSPERGVYTNLAGASPGVAHRQLGIVDRTGGNRPHRTAGEASRRPDEVRDREGRGDRLAAARSTSGSRARAAAASTT